LTRHIRGLARDPYTELSRPIGLGEQDREIHLTSQIVAEYRRRA
jgi:hypothetical protein